MKRPLPLACVLLVLAGCNSQPREVRDRLGSSWDGRLSRTGQLQRQGLDSRAASALANTEHALSVHSATPGSDRVSMPAPRAKPAQAELERGLDKMARDKRW